MKGNQYWRHPFSTSVIVGGRVFFLKIYFFVLTPCEPPWKRTMILNAQILAQAVGLHSLWCSGGPRFQVVYLFE